MNDMASVIVPKSDQLNSDDLIAGPITIKVTGVSIKTGEQPVSISYEGDKGKPYKCCKSMARILVTAWGADSKAYVGRSMTLYRDPSVKWAGMEVGGIRISHMTDIDSKITMALTATKGSRKPYTVMPLKVEAKKVDDIANLHKKQVDGIENLHKDDSETISVDESIALDDRLKEHNIRAANVKKHFGVESFERLTKEQLVEAHEIIETTLAQRKAKAASN